MTHQELDIVRLGANDERHADEEAELTTNEGAQRCLEFSEAIAEMIFVLPTRVKQLAPKPTPPTPVSASSTAAAPRPARR